MGKDESKEKYFQDLIASAKASTDTENPYEPKNFGTDHRESKLRVKWNRIKKTVFGNEGLTQKFKQGVMMGATVGAIFGTIMGVGTAIKTRQLIYIPMFAGIMAGSFGFFMGVGSAVRGETEGEDCSFVTEQFNGSSWAKQVEAPYWKTAHKV